MVQDVCRGDEGGQLDMKQRKWREEQVHVLQAHAAAGKEEL